MKIKSSIYFLCITAASLFVYVKYLSSSSFLGSRAIGLLGFFGLPISIICLGIGLLQRGKRLASHKSMSTGIVVITVGIISLLVVVGITLVGLAWSDN